MRAAIAAAAVAILAGCAASGVQVSQQAATQFHEGVTTETEILKTLGSPTSVTISSGHRTIGYAGVQYQVKPATFIPIVGAFAGGAEYTYSSAQYQIGADGVLEKITFTTTSGQSRAGSRPVDVPSNEPRAVR